MRKNFQDKRYRVITLIPARGGSKRIPCKNLKLLAGKPLIAWSIILARGMPVIDRVVVSTDNPEIAGVAGSYGAETLLRPGALAADRSPAADVIRDAIQRFRREGEQKALLVYLQPTSPLRNKRDVTACLDLLTNGHDSAATFTEAELHPHHAWRISSEKPTLFVPGADPWLTGQQLEKAYRLNGAVYAFHMERFPPAGASVLFGRCGAVLMPRERSVDIDDPLDFMLAELILAALASGAEKGDSPCMEKMS